MASEYLENYLEKKKQEQENQQNQPSAGGNSSYLDVWKSTWAQRNGGRVGNDLANRVNAWIAKVNGFGDSFTSRQKQYGESYQGDSSAYLRSVMDQRYSLITEEKEIRDLLKKYSGVFDAEWLKELDDALNSGSAVHTNVLRSAESNNAYWKQFSSQNDYDWYRKYSPMSMEELYSALGGLEVGSEEYNYVHSRASYNDDWLKEDGVTTVENSAARQARYKHNTDTVAKLTAQYDALTEERKKIEYQMNFGTPEYVARVNEIESRMKQIKAQIDALSAENNRYSHGQGKVDPYFGLTQNDDFAAAPRVYDNITREELDRWDDIHNGTPRTNGEGKLVDIAGNVIDDNWIGYQQPVIEDKLGMFLATDQDTRLQAYDAYYEGTWATVIRDGVYRDWDKLTKDEIGIYYYLLAHEGRDSAYQFLDSMTSELNRRTTAEMAERIQNANGWEKFAWNIASVPANVLGGGMAFIDDTINTIKGEEINPYSKWHSAQNVGQTVRSATAEDINRLTNDGEFLGITLGDAYQSIMSGVDSLVGAMTFGSGYTVLMGMGAASAEAKELYERGASKEQIAWGGVLAGAAELVFEKVSIDHFFDNILAGGTKSGAQLIRNLLIQGGVEASEEMLTEIANTITDAMVMGSRSEFEQSIQEYMEQGYTRAEASSLAVQKVGKNVWKSGIGGLISGGFMGGGASAAQYGSYKAEVKDTGRTIMSADGGVDALKNLANQVAGVSEGKMKARLTKQLSKVDKKATAKNVGNLYNTVHNANDLANAAANQADIAKSLQRKGFGADTAKDIAGALVARYNGQELTQHQEKLLKAVEGNEVVSKAVSDIMANEKSTMGQRSQNIRDFQSDIALGTAINTMAKQHTEKAFTPEGKYAVSPKGEATAMVTEEIDGKTVTKDSGEVIDIKGIKEIHNGRMLLDIGDGKTIDAKNVAYANQGEALVYEAIANLGDNIDADTANKLIAKFDGGNAMVFARGIAQAYTYGFYGLDRAEMRGKHTLSAELTEAQRNEAYALGEKYRPVKDAKDKAAAKATKASGGKGVYYRDKDGKTTDIRTHLDNTKIGLKDVQKTAIEVMEKMSQMMGVRFNVFESWVENGKRYYLDENGVKTEGNPNGFYDTRTGEIYIDLNAGNDYQGTMLFTIAHELTHFMRQWSPEHFTKIAKIVFQHGGMKGNVSKLVALKQAKAKTRGKPISYDTAMEEVVADGMETILKDGKVLEFMEDVKKKDHAAWEKIKEWFQNLAAFLQEMVSAYSGQSAQTVEGAKVAEFSSQLLNQIEQIWAEGAVAARESYQAAKENVTDAKAEKNTTQEGGVKFMSRDGLEMMAFLVPRGKKVNADLYIEDRHGLLLEDIRKHLPELQSMNPVCDLDGTEFQKNPSDTRSLKQKVKDFFDSIGNKVERKELGIIALNNAGAQDSVEHGYGPIKAACFAALPSVIERGLMFGPNRYLDRGHDTYLFVAPVRFVGAKKGDFYVGAYVIRDVNTTRYKIHEVLTINKEGNRPFQPEADQVGEHLRDDSLLDTKVTQHDQIVKSESAEAMDVELDTKTESVAPAVLKSERTWTASDYVQARDEAARDIAKAIGVTEKKAKDYIDSINSIAKMIAEDRVRLDYFSSPGRSSFVGNVEYGGSFDFSTLCKKRRLLTGTFTAIQKALPNTALTANEILDIRNRMKDAGLEVSCGLCYVEGSRANMGQFAKEFLKLYKQYYPDAWQPNMADVNTPDGIEWVRINHPECYEQYEYFWNHYGTLKPGDKNLFASQQKPKLYQLHTEYKGEILEKFNDDDNVEEKNLNGGIRLQSFSDFEIVHLIDTMQIIMDMSRVGLAGQAYTKVPDFAWALGDTGLKINLSLIAKGVDANGKLIFDDVEGMPIAEAMKLRDRYSKNVGTILVAFNDEQLMAAMADDRVDFIIPFHRSQWKKNQYEAMGLPAKTKDYTYMQNEKFIKPQYHEYRGRMVRDKATNYMPNEYWDFAKSGKENAESYLEMCARNNKRPKFYKLLQNNGDGSYSLKADGSTDGYWKLLIDFKMYDNEGNGSPQMPVKPEFNMDEATRMLNDYRGGHSNFPVAQGVVDEFVRAYKDSHKGAKFSDRDSSGKLLGEDQLEYFEKSMARDRNGNLQVVYHGGTVEYEFDTTRGGKGETQYGPGSYFTDAKGYADEYLYYRGGTTKEYYLNIERMFDDTNMGSTSQMPEWKKLEQILRNNGIEEKFIKRFAEDGFAYMSRYLAIKAGAKTSGSWEGSEQLNAILREAGFDGIKGYLNDAYQYAIFTPNQAKLTTNEVPSSFYDTRYSDRDTESVSNRALLANALEGLVKDETERTKIQEYKSNIDLVNAEERKLRDLNEQIKELSFAKGPRDTAKIRQLRDEATKTANRISIYDKQLLRLEASAPLQKVLEREKKKAYQKAEKKGKEALAEYKTEVEAKQKETAEKWRESRKSAVAKARETAEKRDARAKLQKLVLDTVKWISYPAKTDVKCPDILKKPYEAFLQGIDLSSKRLANGGEATKNDLRLANAMDSLATAIDRVMLSQDPSQDVDKVLDIGYLDLPADFVQKLRDVTESIKSMMVEGEYVVNTMTAEEVRKLSQMIRTLNHAIKTMSKLYANLRFANVEALGFDTMDFLDAVGEIEKTGGLKDFAQWDNALPYYAFKRFGKGGESIFEGLMDAQDKLAFLAQDIFDFQEKTWTGKEAKAWSEDTHTITLPNGTELTLTTADAMSIYCLSRREQALPHLLGGGIRVMGIQKGSQKAKDSRSLLTIEDVDAIISSLTDRQKQVAEGIQEFMSTVCSEWGNEISMKRFLTREFTEKFYFPIESNDENLTVKDPAAQQSDLFRLLNISATKPLTQGANNEVIIRNIFDVFTGHTSDMARLNAYGMGLLDYMKWLNYREKTTNEEGQIDVKGVRKSMEKAYGKAANSYVLNLIKDVNGRASDGGDPTILMKWMRTAKTASVGSSLRVATLQITSYPRAALVLSPKSLALGLTKVPNISRAKQYCGIALWKSFGFYDTNISRSIEDQMKGVTDVKQKLIELSLKGAEWGDAITWGALWNACEYEAAKTTTNKVGSEEFYQEVGKKLREVVYRTQVVDSTLTRSQIMRSKRGMAQEAAAFMSEPTLSANILMDAGFEFGLEKRRTGSAKKAWKKTSSYIGRAVAVYSIGQLTAALMEALWDAWRDDDDEEFGEKYLSAFVENLALDLVPFNKLPIVSDVFEAALSMFGVGFYSSDKMSTTWLTQAVSAVDAWKDVFSGESSTTVYNALYKSTRALSSFFGVSVSGVMREGVALWNNTAGAYDATLKILNYDRSKAELGGLLLDAIIDGNDRQADSIRGEFADEDAYQSALRTAIKDRFTAGEIDYNTAMKYLVNYGGMTKDDAYWKMEEWEYESGSDEDYAKYGEFYTAVETGKNLRFTIKVYTDNGVSTDTLSGQITSHFKPIYSEMPKSKRAGLKGYLLNAYELCGVTREDAEEKIAKWEFEADHPELQDKITYTQYKRWEADGKPNGVSIELFVDVAEFRDDGTSNSVKSQGEVQQYIMSVASDRQTRHALWCCFYKASTSPWK